MEMKLGPVPIPVSDIDRAKSFCRVDGAITSFGFAGLGIWTCSTWRRHWGQRSIVAVFELLGGGQAGLPCGGGQGSQERPRDRGVDRDSADRGCLGPRSSTSFPVPVQ